jgi:hypothetical protein
MKESSMSNGNSPAFPCQDNKKQIYTGMNLRDYIAMEALHAFIDSNWSEDPKELAEQAYKVSNAMLDERVKYP